MSETVTETGKLIPVEWDDNLTWIENVDKLSYQFEIEDLDEIAKYFHCDEIVKLDGVYYSIEERSDSDLNGIFEMFRDEDGALRYVVSYYNGGCSHGEAIEEAFEGFNE